MFTINQKLEESLMVNKWLGQDFPKISISQYVFQPLRSVQEAILGYDGLKEDIEPLD